MTDEMMALRSMFEKGMDAGRRSDHGAIELWDWREGTEMTGLTAPKAP